MSGIETIHGFYGSARIYDFKVMKKILYIYSYEFHLYNIVDLLRTVVNMDSYELDFNNSKACYVNNETLLENIFLNHKHQLKDLRSDLRLDITVRVYFKESFLAYRIGL